MIRRPRLEIPKASTWPTASDIADVAYLLFWALMGFALAGYIGTLR